MNESFAILTFWRPQEPLFGAWGEPTNASKLRRSQAEFVHEVVETDAPKRNGQMSEDDATSFTSDSLEVAEVWNNTDNRLERYTSLYA